MSRIDKASKAELINWIGKAIALIRENHLAVPEELLTLAESWDEKNEIVAKTESFDIFWKLYPKERRVNKKAALTEFNKAIARGADVDEILNAVAIFARVENEKILRDPGHIQYIVHPERWLKNDRWTLRVAYEKEAIGLLGQAGYAALIIKGKPDAKI